MTGIEITLAKQLGSLVGRKFGADVIARWTKYRADRFFEGFVESLAEELETGIESSEADAALTKILADDKKSEVLFDSYRKVCFSKSKTLGPKIIGLLTGYLVAEGRMADEVEERVLEAAEGLSDRDLIELFKEFSNQANDADKGMDPKKHAHWVGDAIRIPWNQETHDSAWAHSRASEIDLSPLNFDEVYGASWAGNAARLGLLTSVMTRREVEYNEDSERGVDEPGVLTIYASTVTFEAPCRRLSGLLKRCFGASTDEMNEI